MVGVAEKNILDGTARSFCFKRHAKACQGDDCTYLDPVLCVFMSPIFLAGLQPEGFKIGSTYRPNAEKAASCKLEWGNPHFPKLLFKISVVSSYGTRPFL